MSATIHSHVGESQQELLIQAAQEWLAFPYTTIVTPTAHGRIATVTSTASDNDQGVHTAVEGNISL